MHPSEVLFQGDAPPVQIPACDHYAGSEKLMLKSMALQQELGPVFDVTFDCEDGAAAGNEAVHARLVGELIASRDNRFQRIALIDRYNADVPVHVLIETHGALRDVFAIAALPRVECLSFGIMDFVSAHYGAIPAAAMLSPGQFTHPLVARAKLDIAAACHAYGKVASHNVTTEIADTGVVRADALRASREFGYTRMWSIHPAQVRPIVAAFAPDPADTDDAVAILTAAQAVQWAPIQHKGKLHDRASYRYFWTVLQRAKLGGAALSAQAAALTNTPGAPA
jgi:citrate lyase subunit beta/citryl-CoA lyase